jgi:hypothetical protein
MSKYIANENGDWWEVVEGDGLYLIDTDNPDIAEAMKEEDASPDNDKFEKFIWQYGTTVYIDMEGVRV